MALTWIGLEEVAIFPWIRNLRKANRPCQYAIELPNHVIRILKLQGFLEITFPWNRWSNAWSEADHSTAHSGTLAICKGTVSVIRILLAQLNTH